MTAADWDTKLANERRSIPAERLKPVYLRLSPEDHARLRVAAAKAGVPMSEFAHAAVMVQVTVSEITRPAKKP
jgi:predicted HicB family RNase H-like nuclease